MAFIKNWKPVDITNCEIHEIIQNDSSPNDLRFQGFMVAIHNDYMLNGEKFTYWQMTKKFGEYMLAFIGEGKTDEEALNKIREQVARSKE